jgi:hypothetical protein
MEKDQSYLSDAAYDIRRILERGGMRLFRRIYGEDWDIKMERVSDFKRWPRSARRYKG